MSRADPPAESVLEGTVEGKKGKDDLNSRPFFARVGGGVRTHDLRIHNPAL